MALLPILEQQPAPVRVLMYARTTAVLQFAAIVTPRVPAAAPALRPTGLVYAVIPTLPELLRRLRTPTLPVLVFAAAQAALAARLLRRRPTQPVLVFAAVRAAPAARLLRRLRIPTLPVAVRAQDNGGSKLKREDKGGVQTGTPSLCLFALLKTAISFPT